MHTKTNDELAEIIYDENNKDDEALQQLITPELVENRELKREG